MTRKTKRTLRSVSLAAVISTFGGIAVGLWMHLPGWFFAVNGLVLALGFMMYPSRKHHHTSSFHLEQKSIEDEP